MERFQATLEATFARMKPYNFTPEEQMSRREKERAEQTLKFEQALDYVVRSQFGPYYARVHTREDTTMIESVEDHIQELYEQGIGCYYSCSKAGGKTHVLLETFRKLATLEWNDLVLTRCYPNAYDFIEKTCHYVTVKELCDILSHKERPRIARYNFIDGLGFEDLSYVLGNIECYFEEINRKGQAMVIASKLDREMLSKKTGYNGILSITYEGCKFYRLPEVDRRITREVAPNLMWRSNHERI